SELPVPIRGTAATGGMGPQLISPSANRAGVKPVSKTTPAAMPEDNARSSLKINGASQTAAPSHADSQVRQAVATEPFDWGDLGLGASTAKAAATAASTTASSGAAQWASVRSPAAEPSWAASSSGDTASGGWKQAQR